MLRRKLGLRTWDLKEARATPAPTWFKGSTTRAKESKNLTKPNKTTNFKKKKNKAELTCFACGETGHFAKDCFDGADRRGKKGNSTQWSLARRKTKGMVIYLSSSQYFNHLAGGLILVLMFMCALTLTCSLLITEGLFRCCRRSILDNGLTKCNQMVRIFGTIS